MQDELASRHASRDGRRPFLFDEIAKRFSRLPGIEPRCTVIDRYARAASFASGITTLAISRISPRCHDPDVKK